MPRNREEMLAAVMLEKADLQIVNWFNRYCRGMEPSCTRADVLELIEFIELRDQLRLECGKPIPALPAAVVDEEEPELGDDSQIIEVEVKPARPKRVRGFVGMGM